MVSFHYIDVYLLVASFVDAQNMGKWSNASWGKDRGPDPLDVHYVIMSTF